MTQNKALKYFLNLLKARDYSVKSLIEKGKKKEYEELEIQQAIDFLLKNNFLNDLRLAKNIIQKYKDEKGFNWIKQKLFLKGISKADIQQALSEFEIQEFQPSLKLKQRLENKYKIDFRNWSEIEQKTKQKVILFLQSRGYLNALEIIQNWTLD
jgi:SOS response regulatory protein OraA/RecX